MRPTLIVLTVLGVGIGSTYASLSIRTFRELVDYRTNPTNAELFKRSSSQSVDVLGCPLNQIFCQANSGCCKSGEVCCGFGCCAGGSKCNEEAKRCEAPDGKEVDGTKCWKGNYACSEEDSPGKKRCCPRNRVCKPDGCAAPESTMTKLPEAEATADTSIQNAPVPVPARPPPPPPPAEPTPDPPAPPLVDPLTTSTSRVPIPTATRSSADKDSSRGTDSDDDDIDEEEAERESSEDQARRIQKTNRTTGIIVGCVLGTLCLAIIIFIAWSIYRCYKQRPKRESNIFVSGDFSSTEGGPSPPQTMRHTTHFELLKRKSSVLRMTLARIPSKRSIKTELTKSDFTETETETDGSSFTSDLRSLPPMPEKEWQAARVRKGDESEGSIVIGWTKSFFGSQKDGR